MPAANHTTPVVRPANPNDPSTWLKPDEPLVGADGRDWSWCYVEYRLVRGWQAYCVGTNGTAWSRWKKGNRWHAGSPTDGPWRRLKSTPNDWGYRTVGLCDESGRMHTKAIHRLILETFVGPRPHGMEGCHWDGNKNSNALSNLRWGTPESNYADRIRHGTALDHPTGENGYTAKLTNFQATEALRLHRAEGLGAVRIVRRLGLPENMHGAIGAVLNGRAWSHLTGIPKPPRRKRRASGKLVRVSGTVTIEQE